MKFIKPTRKSIAIGFTAVGCVLLSLTVISNATLNKITVSTFVYVAVAIWLAYMNIRVAKDKASKEAANVAIVVGSFVSVIGVLVLLAAFLSK